MKKITMLAFALALALILVGCGGRTAADYLAANDPAQLNAFITQVRGWGMDLVITTEGGTLIYTYRYLEQVDPGAFARFLNETETRNTAEAILAEMRAFNVTDPAVRYVYMNADNTVLFDVTFE